MKSFTLGSLALAASVAAAPQAKGKTGSGGLGALLSGRPGSDPFANVTPLMGLLGNGGITNIVANVVNQGYGKVADPAGAAPKRAVLDSRTKVAGAETIKIRYGPYKIPSVNTKNIIGEAGALFNYPHLKVDKPCDGDCMIIGINAGLEFPDGKNANIDNGLWLHHMVLLAEGPGRKDATCGDSTRSLPHVLVGSNSTSSERIFSSGNERTPAIVPQWNPGALGGIKLNGQDKFHLIVDLMNTNEKDEVAYLTLTYDVIKGHPKEVDEIKVVWFDLAQCGTSEIVPLAQTGAWNTKAPTWTANFNGEILGAAGHLHDGGTNIQLLVDGNVVCDSTATYGGSPEFIGKGMGGGHHGGATKHISNMSICVGDSFKAKEIKPGQKWDLKAFYDYDKYPGMSHEGDKQDNVMGIAIMFARVKKQ